MTERSKEHVITFVGIDLAKRSFHVHAADEPRSSFSPC